MKFSGSCAYCLAVAMALTAATRPAEKAYHGSWKTYVNVRYGYSICYPSLLLRAQRESDNSDGRAFTGRDGAQLVVFGSKNILESSLSKEAADETRDYIGQKGKITYQAAGRGWIVISGNDGTGTEFYSKTVQRRHQFLAFQLKYPARAAQTYRPIAQRLNRCFSVLKPPF